MKKSIVTVVCFAIAGLSLYGQEIPKIKVEEKTNMINGNSNNTLTVIIYETDKSEIEKAFKNELKDRKAKVSVKKEIFADDAQFKNMGDNTVDVYARVEEGKTGNTLVAAVDLGGAYLSSAQHKDKYDAFRAFLYDFAVKMTKEGVSEQIKDAEKLLGKQENELEGLVKDKEGLEKDIEDYKKKIEDAKKGIEQNIKDQEAKNKEVEGQKKVVEELQLKQKAVK